MTTATGDLPEMQASDGPVLTVRMDAIHLNPAWQVRAKTDRTVARRYADAMSAGQAFPPIHLADLDGTLWLVDGWHRHAATRMRSEGTITAIIVTNDAERAQWLAVEPNLRHGLPFNRAERRGVFRAYVKGGQHRKRGKAVKSSREIAADLHGLTSHATVLAWMRKDYPEIAARMTGGKDEPSQDFSWDPDRLEEALTVNARDALGQMQAAFNGLRSPVRRGELIAEYGAALAAMREAGAWTPSEPPSEHAADWDEFLGNASGAL